MIALNAAELTFLRRGAGVGPRLAVLDHLHDHDLDEGAAADPEATLRSRGILVPDEDGGPDRIAELWAPLVGLAVMPPQTFSLSAAGRIERWSEFAIAGEALLRHGVSSDGNHLFSGVDRAAMDRELDLLHELVPYTRSDEEGLPNWAVGGLLENGATLWHARSRVYEGDVIHDRSLCVLHVPGRGVWSVLNSAGNLATTLAPLTAAELTAAIQALDASAAVSMGDPTDTHGACTPRSD